MPIYEYECPECGRFEAVQKVSDEPLKKNPDCKKSNCPCKAERIISASAFHLKGSGWYKTDYPGGSSGGGSTKKSSAASSDSSTDSSASSSEKSTEGGGEKKSLKTTGGCGSGCGCH